MITKNLLLKRGINIIVLILSISYSSCTSIKSGKKENISFYLEDFIKSYKSYDIGEPLAVIMISTKFEDNNVEYIINDAPQTVYFGDLNNLKEDKKQNILMGTYKGILCKIQSDSVQNYRHILKKLDEEIINKAQQAKIQKDDNGKSYTLDLSLLNWSPELTIIYNSENNNKEIILNGTILK